MRVLVCGGRDFGDEEFLNFRLNDLHVQYKFTHLIHGAARGADTLAASWAWAHGITPLAFPADWALGKGAGPLRNQQMLDEGKPDLVVAFPGGAGTRDMVNRSLGQCDVIQYKEQEGRMDTLFFPKATMLAVQNLVAINGDA